MSTDDRILSKSCIANAMISAVQNFRDNPEITPEALLESNVGEEASGYLRDMPDTCQCHVFAIEDVKDTYKLYNEQYAKRAANGYLNAGRLTLMDYTKLMGWLDRAVRNEWTVDLLDDPWNQKSSNPDSIGAGYPEESM
jgi:hypothetical protein